MTARDEARLVERWESIVARELRGRVLSVRELVQAERKHVKRSTRARQLEGRMLATMGAW